VTPTHIFLECDMPRVGAKHSALNLVLQIRVSSPNASSLRSEAAQAASEHAVAGHSPSIWSTISRDRGRMSKSMRTTCCQVPRMGRPDEKGMVSEGPSSEARTWE